MIKNGRPFTDNGNGNVDDTLLNRHKHLDIKVVGEWIRNNIEPSDDVYGTGSYALKHKLEHDTKIYMTNNEFKDAMLLAGYEPVDPDENSWHFRCSYIPDKVINPSPFFAMAKDRYTGDPSPEGDFVEDMVCDKEFPVFAEHDIIKEYLENKGACDGAMAAFEVLWKEYEDTRNV